MINTMSIFILLSPILLHHLMVIQRLRGCCSLVIGVVHNLSIKSSQEQDQKVEQGSQTTQICENLPFWDLILIRTCTKEVIKKLRP